MVSAPLRHNERPTSVSDKEERLCLAYRITIAEYLQSTQSSETLKRIYHFVRYLQVVEGSTGNDSNGGQVRERS